MAQKSQYKIFVEAYDDGTPSFSTTAQLIINVEPANFFVPEFDTNQRLTFPENLPAGTLVGRVRVTDLDSNPLLYEIMDVTGGSLDWLNIDPANGDLRLTAQHNFDFESGAQYSIEVRVTETIPNGSQVTGVIPITVTNLNDRPTGVADLTIYPLRFGTPVTSDFAVIDQDPALLKYTITTTDSRFEIRNGRLALKSTELQASNTVGQTLQVPLLIVDNGDATSFANVLANVTVVAATPWQNPVNAADVNRDGIVTNSDALLIINRLNDGRGARPLSVPRAFSDLSLGDIDSTGDNFLSPADALRVINALNANRPGGEGESSSSLSSPEESPAAWLLAYNQLEDEAIVRRKR